MRDIVIGEPVNGYSTALVWQEDGFRVSLGSTNSGAIYPALPVATCEVFGIWVVLTDPNKYAELRAACKEKRSADIRKLLVSFVTQEIAERPELFTAVLDDRYDQGVQDGKRAKVREFQRLLEVN